MAQCAAKRGITGRICSAKVVLSPTGSMKTGRSLSVARGSHGGKMWSRSELVNRLMANVMEEYESQIASTGNMTLTTPAMRRFVEEVIEETKKHIAKKLVENRKGTIEVLAKAGCFGFDDEDDVEMLVLEALKEL